MDINKLLESTWPGFGNINVQEMLYTRMSDIERGCSLHDFLKGTVRSVLSTYDKSGSGNITFIYSSTSGLGRKDHLSYFQNLCNTWDKKCVIIISGKIGFNLSGLRNTFYIFGWYRKARKNGLSSSSSRRLVWLLHWVKSEGEMLYHAANKKSLVVTYCDGMLSDYYITALADADSVSTATVQHGVFANDSWAYRFSHSKFFIANSIYSKKQAENIGLKRVVVGGMLQEMQSKPRDIIRKEGVFSIFLDGGGGQNNATNKMMVDFAHQLAEKYHLQYILRYHPGSPGSTVHDDNDPYLAYISNKAETVDQVFEKSDFVVVCASTVIFQAIIRLIPTFRYANNSEKRFLDMSFDSFSSYEEMKAEYDDMVYLNIDDLKKRKEEIIGVEDIKENYKNVFQAILCHTQ